MPATEPRKYCTESGNVLFYILIGIVLIALVTVALKRGGDEGSNIDSEQTVIAASQVKQYASELERGVDIILHNGISESDVRFAHPQASSDYGDITSIPTRQVFDRQGGGVEYRSGGTSSANDGSGWEFYATTTLPQVGSANRPDLIAVLPNVTSAVCQRINAMDGYGSTQPADTVTCLYTGAAGRFAGVYDDVGVPNTTDEATFSVKPAMEACIVCDDGKFHFYHVLIAR